MLLHSMSVSEKKEKKVLTPSTKDSPTDMSTSPQADLEKSSPSGNACICVVKRNIACVLHGG